MSECFSSILDTELKTMLANIAEEQKDDNYCKKLFTKADKDQLEPEFFFQWA